MPWVGVGLTRVSGGGRAQAVNARWPRKVSLVGLRAMRGTCAGERVGRGVNRAWFFLQNEKWGGERVTAKHMLYPHRRSHNPARGKVLARRRLKNRVP